MFAILLHLVRLCLARFETENISSRILGIKNFIWCNMQYLEIKKTGEKFYYRTVLSPTEACNGNGWHYNSHRPDWHGWHLAATVVTLRYIKKIISRSFTILTVACLGDPSRCYKCHQDHSRCIITRRNCHYIWNTVFKEPYHRHIEHQSSDTD